MRGRKKRLLLMTLAVIAFLAASLSAAAAWSSSDTPTDSELFYKGTGTDEALAVIVDRLTAQGILIESAGVVEGDEPTYQVVLSSSYDRPVLVAHEVWREAMLVKSEGLAVPAVEVFQFDLKGMLVFGFGQPTELPKDVTHGKPASPASNARSAVASLVASLLAENSNGSLGKQVSKSVALAENAHGGRIAELAIDFPASATNEEIDEFVLPLSRRIERLNEQNGTAVAVARLQLHRGTELVLEQIVDYQMDNVTGWHSPSYIPKDVGGGLAGPKK